MLTDLWQRATATQTPLTWEFSLLLAGVALTITWSPWGYRVARHVVTLIHEAGHATVALLAGRRLTGIRLHVDSSGLTVSRGRPRGPGMVATVFAGYAAPAVVAAAGAWLLGLGHAAGVLWALTGACALMLLAIRNWYGLWVVLATGTGVGLLSWFSPAPVLTAVAYLLVWVLLFAAPRSLVSLSRARRRGGGTSDADQLARLTKVPAWCWIGLYWLTCVAALGVGAWLLVPIPLA